MSVQKALKSSVTAHAGLDRPWLTDSNYAITKCSWCSAAAVRLQNGVVIKQQQLLFTFEILGALGANCLWLTSLLSEHWWFLRRKATKPNFSHFTLITALKQQDSFVQLTASQASNCTQCYWLPSSASLYYCCLLMYFSIQNSNL